MEVLMKRGYRFWMLIASLLAIQWLLLGMRYPVPLYSPGDLVNAHSNLRCKRCHAPFKKVPSESCSVAKCHPEGKVGKKPIVIKLHNKVKSKDCLLCHSEHLGPKGKVTKAFNHTLIENEIRCLECHSTEYDKAHKGKTGTYSADCASCHNTRKWTEASFDHATVGTKSCLDCHDGPKNDLHKVATGSCAECHNTKAWKPSRYDHDKYFLLDADHKLSCNKCHDPWTYKKYTCLNCHEHSGQKIEREHMGEGITSYGDCLTCHSVTINGRSYGSSKVHEWLEGEEDEGDENRHKRRKKRFKGEDN
jgi:predicted CXXCH cytochrome family protein